MALTLPNPGNIFLPSIPKGLDPVMTKYLEDLTRVLIDLHKKSFDNTYSIVSTGTSGTFKSSAGDSITVQSGVITALA